MSNRRVSLVGIEHANDNLRLISMMTNKLDRSDARLAEGANLMLLPKTSHLATTTTFERQIQEVEGA